MESEQEGTEAWLKAKLSHEPTAEENQAATEAWRPFMVELKALLDKYDVTEFGGCSCCDGLNIAVGDVGWVANVGWQPGRARILRWEGPGYTYAQLGDESSGNP